MKKIIIFIAIMVFVFIGVYYFQFQTYFMNTEVMEVSPMTSGATKPKIVKQGNFIDADFIHKGTGKVFVLEYPDGKKVLRVEDLDITNGPDLHIYLSKTNKPSSIESLGEYYDLGLLKGNKGDQNYELPAGVSDFNSVVVWCEKFGVLFPYAVLN